MIARVFHTILALSVFFSTTGFTLNRHYCRNQLQGVGLFAPATNCQHSAKASCCKDHRGCALQQEVEPKGCCHNTISYYKLEQEKQVLANGFPLLKNPVLPLASITISKLKLPVSIVHLPSYQLFKPPIVCEDHQALLQTFRL